MAHTIVLIMVISTQQRLSRFRNLNSLAKRRLVAAQGNYHILLTSGWVHLCVFGRPALRCIVREPPRSQPLVSVQRPFRFIHIPLTSGHVPLSARNLADALVGVRVFCLVALTAMKRSEYDHYQQAQVSITEILARANAINHGKLHALAQQGTAGKHQHASFC